MKKKTKLFKVTLHYAPIPGAEGPEKVTKLAIRDLAGNLIYGQPMTQAGAAVEYEFYRAGAVFGDGNNARRLYLTEDDIAQAEEMDIDINF